jgi:hypothetical protein
MSSNAGEQRASRSHICAHGSPANFRRCVRCNRRHALPGNVNVENKRAPNGDVHVWLDPATVAKLRHLRGPGDSYSDAIIALAGAVRLTAGCATDAS